MFVNLLETKLIVKGYKFIHRHFENREINNDFIIIIVKTKMNICFTNIEYNTKINLLVFPLLLIKTFAYGHPKLKHNTTQIQKKNIQES